MLLGANDLLAGFAPPAADDERHPLETLRAVGVGGEVEVVHPLSVSTFAHAGGENAQVSNFDAIQAAVRAQQPPPPVSGLAIASLSLGAVTLLPALFALLIQSGGALAGILYYLLVGAPAVLAIVFGFIASGPTKRGERRGYAMAKLGIVFGFIALVAPYLAALLATASR